METIYRTAIISTQICRSGPLVVPCPLTWDSALVAAPAATPILCRSNRGFAAKWHVNGHATTMLHLLAGTAAQTPSFRYSQPRGIKFPACGNIIPSLWEHYSQPVGIKFPAAGNRIPSPWESCSQPLGIGVPRAVGISSEATGAVFPLLKSTSHDPHRRRRKGEIFLNA